MDDQVTYTTYDATPTFLKFDKAALPRMVEGDHSSVGECVLLARFSETFIACNLDLMINGRRKSFKKPMMADRLQQLWEIQSPKAKRVIAEVARNTGCAQFFEAF